MGERRCVFGGAELALLWWSAELEPSRAVGVAAENGPRLRDGVQAVVYGCWLGVCPDGCGKSVCFPRPGEPAPQLSGVIDSQMSPSLSRLPDGAGDQADLAPRNLRRGVALGLHSGQAAAEDMGEVPLTDAELALPSPGPAALWFYVVREAEIKTGGAHLGPIGGRIVGETLLGLLRADPRPYLQLDPGWRPTLPTRAGDPAHFDLVDLLTAAVPAQCQSF